MATIITKTTSGSALVLNSKEALLYPFNLGNWTQIRFGMFVGATSSNDTNSQYSNEQLNCNAPQNGFYFGLVTNIDPNNLLPYGDTQNFIGVGAPTGVAGSVGTIAINDNRINSQAGNGNLSAFVTVSGKFQVFQDGLNAGSSANVHKIYLPDKVNITGAVGFAGFYGVKITINNAGSTFQTFDIATSDNSEAQYTDISIDNLRNQLSNFNSPNTTTGFRWNSQMSITGGTPLPLPSGLLLFCPLSQNRIKTFCLDIDKY